MLESTSGIATGAGTGNTIMKSCFTSQVTQMGRKDLELKQEIQTLLQDSWKEWVKDINDYTKSVVKTLPSKSTGDGESETDHDALQREWLMAQDEYDYDFSSSKEISIPILFEEPDNGEIDCGYNHWKYV